MWIPGGMALPQVADRGDKSPDMEDRCELVEYAVADSL